MSLLVPLIDWRLRSYLPDDHPDKPLELGQEETPEEFVQKLVEIFREICRVLHPTGTCWVNLGDSYNSSSKRTKQSGNVGRRYGEDNDNHLPLLGDLQSGNLIGVPWRFAFAMQADGWILRQEIIWSKAGAMPESVTNRCTKSHEHIFLFAKKSKYYFDHVAIMERSKSNWNWERSAGNNKKVELKKNGFITGGIGTKHDPNDQNKSFCRDVWHMSHEGGLKEAHFAPFPKKLALRCILAGSSQKGICKACGSPWKRILEKTRTPTRPGRESKIKEILKNRKIGQLDPRFQRSGTSTKTTLGSVIGNRDLERHVSTTKTIGWEPTCKCNASDPVPAIICDPFSGSATAGIVAITRGRRFIGIDLSEEYIEMGHRRLKKAELARGFGF